jgi:hypothetical protein
MAGMTDSRKRKPSCNWLQRWWHSRLRKADLRFMLPALRQAHRDAQARGGLRMRVGFADAWAVFKAQPEQAHWRCACYRAAFTARAERLLCDARDEDV